MKMKALVYHGPGKIAWEEKPKPAIRDPSDAIVKIIYTSICGTDLRILKGDFPGVQPGRILGHEGVGVVEEVGEDVSRFQPGDKVLISCMTSCGQCVFCKRQMYSQCEKGGWQLGRLIDGTQAEYVRIPYADYSLYRVPDGLCESPLVLLSHLFPTGLERGVLQGQVKPGDMVAIVGTGPVGLAALLTARLYSPLDIILIGLHEYRLGLSKRLGATGTIHPIRDNGIEMVMERTEGRGVDVAIDTAGVPATVDICQKIVKPGGTIAIAGVPVKPVTLDLETLRKRNITLTTGLADTHTIPMLLKAVQSKILEPQQLISHSFPLDEILAAYREFGNARKNRVLKVLLTNEA